MAQLAVLSQEVRKNPAAHPVTFHSLIARLYIIQIK
jgi:hypothetical protein